MTGDEVKLLLEGKVGYVQKSLLQERYSNPQALLGNEQGRRKPKFSDLLHADYIPGDLH